MGKRSPILVLVSTYVDARDQYDAGQRSKYANELLYGEFLYTEQCPEDQSPDTYRNVSFRTKMTKRGAILLLVDVNIVELATVVYSRHAATK